MTQKEMVLSWLKKTTIGPMEAMRELGIMRLAARIKDLRDDGHHIEMTWEYVRDRFGEERRVARYTLKELANGTAPKNKDKVGQSGSRAEKPSTSRMGSWLRLLGLRLDPSN